MADRTPAALMALIMCMIATPLRAEDDSLSGGEDWPVVAAAIHRINDTLATSPFPLSAPLAICVDSGCRHWHQETVEDDEAAQLWEIMAGADSPADERRRLRLAIARWEEFMGWRNGTWRDQPGNAHDPEDDAGQLDCIAEAINTRTYLDRLSIAGLIHHHQIDGFVHRYTLLLQHVAVSLSETGTADEDTAWVVDSWVGANGEPPDIQPYADWRMGWAI